VICSCSGGTFGGLHQAVYDVYDSWARATNASGGLDGHQIALTEVDDQANPALAASAVGKLVSAKVVAIVDMSLLDSVWAGKAAAARIPVAGGDVANAVFSTNADFFPQGQTPNAIADAMMATAKETGASKIGILYCAEAVVCQQLLAPEEKAAQAAGLKIAFTASITATAPNYTSQCLAAQQAHVTALLVFHAAEVVSRVGADCKRQSYTPAYVTEGGGFSNLLVSAPGVNDNLWTVFSDLPYFADSPAVLAANAAIDKYHPGLRADPNNWSELAFEAWVCAQLLQAAVKESGLGPSGTPSADVIAKGLHAIKNNDLDGLAPPLTFVADGRPNVISCWYVGRVRNGGKTSVANGGKAACPAA
jgi:branched-chain amino acid transport system substrate-binding protein